MNDGWSFETRQIHAGQTPDPPPAPGRCRSTRPPRTCSSDTDHAANLFALKEFGNIYTRIMNPTQDAVEQRLASLEGGVGALLVASGQAAETLAILNVAEAGDHIVSSPSLYGGTYNLFHYTLPKLGIEVSFVEDPDDLDSWRAAVRPNTKAFFGETISNPKQDILDIEGVAGVAHEVGVPLIVDNTVATPYLIRPLEWGADIVVHSTTKYLGGHGTSIGGVIVDGGHVRLRPAPRAVPELQPARPELPRAGLRPRPRRRQRLRGQPVVHPQGAGAAAARPRSGDLAVQRLPARAGPGDAQPADRAARRQRAGGRAVAAGPRRGRVASPTPACRAAPGTRSAQKYAPNGPGAVLAFEIKGGVEAGKRFVDALELHSHVANIGDVRSLVIHPASTTHSQLRRGGAARHRRHAGPGPARRSASSTSTTSWPTSRPGFRRRPKGD